MKKYINLFYILVVLVGFVLWQIHREYTENVLSFYGFAENKETEINFNYPVAIGKIYVQAGQRVKAGDKLVDMYRIRAKEKLSEETFLIAELGAKEAVWRNQKKGDLEILELKKDRDLAAIDAKIKALSAERNFQQKLYEGLIETDTIKYAPLKAKIDALEQEKDLIAQNFRATRLHLEKELRLGKNPYQQERERLQAQLEFDAKNSRVEIPLLAPHDGLVGNLYCKEGEHMESFSTILSLYEPNPTLVEGYVQEDLILQVHLNDRFKIRSTKDEDVLVHGEVAGLGSRIVEIPERLRRMPDLKTYGREVLIRIPSDNDFLQKEKVILEFETTEE
ncbi:MAG: hypothetical protein AAF849_01225 [Bacteroidota bacterium]